MPQPVTNLATIAADAQRKEIENDAFRDFIMQQDDQATDALVQQLNARIAPQISCTDCGNCCRSLMINLNPGDVARISQHINVSPQTFTSTYLATGLGDTAILNQMPCPFLSGNACSVYEHRFDICHAFPHLDQPGFSRRLFNTLMHYAICPIIYNVVEALKTETGFIMKNEA
jgi:hypothetical protein